MRATVPSRISHPSSGLQRRFAERIKLRTNGDGLFTWALLAGQRSHREIAGHDEKASAIALLRQSTGVSAIRQHSIFNLLAGGFLNGDLHVADLCSGERDDGS